jgi:hypothetical protein
LAILKFGLFLNPNPVSVAKIIQRITAKRPILQSEENRIFKRKKAVMEEAKPLFPNIHRHRIFLKKPKRSDENEHPETKDHLQLIRGRGTGQRKVGRQAGTQT